MESSSFQATSAALSQLLLASPVLLLLLGALLFALFRFRVHPTVSLFVLGAVLLEGLGLITGAGMTAWIASGRWEPDAIAQMSMAFGAVRVLFHAMSVALFVAAAFWGRGKTS